MANSKSGEYSHVKTDTQDKDQHSSAGIPQDQSSSQDFKIKAPVETSIDNVRVRVVVTGGDPKRRFPGVPDLETTLSHVDTDVAVIMSLVENHQISRPLHEIYDLAVFADHERGYFCFTDDNRVRRTIALTKLKDETGAIGRWKRQVILGQLPTAAPCECTNFGEACQGAPHMPEVHAVFSLDHLIEQAHNCFEADTLNEETIAGLELELAQLKERIQKDEMERLELKAANAACKLEIDDLKSQNTGLRLNVKDMEDQVNGAAKRRTLRSRGMDRS